MEAESSRGQLLARSGPGVYDADHHLRGLRTCGQHLVSDRSQHETVVEGWGQRLLLVRGAIYTLPPEIEALSPKVLIIGRFELPQLCLLHHHLLQHCILRCCLSSHDDLHDGGDRSGGGDNTFNSFVSSFLLRDNNLKVS